MLNESKLSQYIRPALMIALIVAVLGVPLISGWLGLIWPEMASQSGKITMDLLASVPPTAWDAMQWLFAAYSIPKSAEKITAMLATPKPAPIEIVAQPIPLIAPNQEEDAPWTKAQ